MQLPNWYLKFIFLEDHVQECGCSYSDYGCCWKKLNSFFSKSKWFRVSSASPECRIRQFLHPHFQSLINCAPKWPPKFAVNLRFISHVKFDNSNTVCIFTKIILKSEVLYDSVGISRQCLLLFIMFVYVLATDKCTW